MMREAIEWNHSESRILLFGVKYNRKFQTQVWEINLRQSTRKSIKCKEMEKENVKSSGCPTPDKQEFQKERIHKDRVGYF